MLNTVLEQSGRIIDWKGRDLSLSELEILMKDVAVHRACQTPVQQEVRVECSALTKKRLIRLALANLDPGAENPLRGPEKVAINENAKFTLHLPEVTLDVRFSKALPSGVLVALDYSDLIFRDGNPVDVRTPQAHVVVENFTLNPP